MKATTRPNPPFDGRLILTVESALREAWRLVDTRHDRAELFAADEDRITLWIEEALYELREQASEGKGGIAGFDRTTFERVQRGAAMRDYTGTKISKQPDLIFRPVGRRSEGIDAFHDGHIVECKLLDERSGKSIGLYASKGISRFVTGDYGWAMSHAGMLAYVRTSEELPTHLETYFQRSENLRAYYTDGRVIRCHLSVRASPATYVSTHDRPITFHDGSAPGPIKVRHLWLSVRPACSP